MSKSSGGSGGFIGFLIFLWWMGVFDGLFDNNHQEETKAKPHIEAKAPKKDERNWLTKPVKSIEKKEEIPTLEPTTTKKEPDKDDGLVPYDQFTK